MNKKTFVLISLVEFFIIIIGFIYFLGKRDCLLNNPSLNSQPETSVEVLEKIAEEGRTNDDLKMYEKDKEAFPKILDGYERYLIDLPQKSNENGYEVELLTGKVGSFDCNRQMINGTYETKTVAGFGYDYYVFNSDGVIGSTQMACLDDVKTEKFVSQSLKVGYNSKLPLVIFAPKGFEVRYNIWEAGQLLLKATRQ